MDMNFDGEIERVPVVDPNATKEEFVAIARILASGLKQVGLFSLKFGGQL